MGARVVESRHTNRWRFACKEMHAYFSSEPGTSPGKLSEGLRAGMENQHSTHSGKWDRNSLVAAMLEIKLSMTGHALDKVKYDTLTMWDRICGGAANVAITDKDHTGTGPAGYRVPTNRVYDPEFATYDTGNVPITDFSPLVAFGSLETLRSMRMPTLNACPKGLAPEDGLTYQYCENNQQYLVDDMLTRASYAPFSLQRDIWCNPHQSLSVEQAVGNPEYFEEALYDTSIKDRFSINDLVVSGGQRNEENIEDKTWVKRSLRSWVYVTSSADINIRAGMYRLSDIALFREQSCDELPNVQCSNATSFVDVDHALPDEAISPTIREIWKLQDFFTRTILTNKIERINAQMALVDGIGSASEWINGRDALPKYRCNSALARYIGTECEHSPFQSPSRAQCTTSDLLLLSRPTVYGTKHWFSRLARTPSPSPPPPPPNPRPPPKPPSPHTPPAPPKSYSQAEVMLAIRQAEERVCTSVYYLSQTTRCERFAIELTQRWLMEFTSPPTVPPGNLLGPSPPPISPPLPSMPTGFNPLPVYAATLSTFRLPVALPGGVALDTFGFYTDDLDALRTTLANTSMATRACTASAPIGCISGALVAQCLNGGRRCVDETANTASPWVDVHFKLSGGSYLWGLKLLLPRNTQLAERSIGPKKIEVFGARDEPLDCAEGNDPIVGVPKDWVLIVVCHAPTATDVQLHALAKAYRIRLTLTGASRQIWLNGIVPFERPLTAAGVQTAPSPPPPNPSAPPAGVDLPYPPPPPTATSPCDFLTNVWISSTVSLRRIHEPCGMDRQECCLHKKEHEAEGADAFELDDAGCCTIVYLDGGLELLAVSVSTDVTRHGAWLSTSGTGT